MEKIFRIGDLMVLRDKVWEKFSMPEHTYVLSHTDLRLVLCQHVFAEEFARVGKTSWEPNDELPTRAKQIFVELMVWLLDHEYQMGFFPEGETSYST